MTDSCPYCARPLQVSVSEHATARLDERAYLHYFRRFKLGEDKKRFLMRTTIEAIKQGQKLKAEPQHIAIWYRGIQYILKRAGKALILLTVYPSNLPKKRQWLLEATQ